MTAAARLWRWADAMNRQTVLMEQQAEEARRRNEQDRVTEIIKRGPWLP